MEPLEFPLSTSQNSSSIFAENFLISPSLDGGLRLSANSKDASSLPLEFELPTVARTGFLDNSLTKGIPGLIPSNLYSDQEPQRSPEFNDTLLKCDPTVSIAAAKLDYGTEKASFLNITGLSQFTQAETVLQLVPQSLITQLEEFVNRASFVEQMQVAFGNNWDAESARTLLQEVISGKKFPSIQVVESVTLDPEGKPGTYGAFSIDTNTIYLSRELLTQHDHNSRFVEAVLLEELGHYIDSQLNQFDSLGDEGNIFAKLVQGQLTEPEVPALKIKNDHATVKIGGRSIEIEQASPWSRGANGLAAQYFDNRDFTGVKLTRIDSTVNFDWGNNSPGTAIDRDTFSVRWLGQVQAPETGTFTFYTQSDDGVRLWINGKLLIDNWTDHAVTENKGRIDLVSGQKYSIKLEYYENLGGATAKLLWSSPTIQKQIIPQSRLYSGDLWQIGFDGASAHDTYISTYERNGSLAALGYPTNNVHRWGNGYIQDFDRGSNGRGAIMKSDINDNSYWVDGKFWTTYLSASGADGLLKYPTSDVYSTKLGLRQNFQGGAILQSKSGTLSIYGAIGEKYLQLGAENSYLGFPTSKETVERDGWTKQKFEGGYILWKAGQGAIAYKNPDTSAIPNDWQGSTRSWNVQFWNNKDLSGTPVFERTDRRGAIRFDASLGAPQDTRGVQEDNFSARWSTRSYFEGGFYDFISEADDGVHVYIDGIKVIDKWNAREPWSRHDGFVLVPKGNHDVVVEYFEKGDIAGQNFYWKPFNMQQGWTGALIPVGFDGTSVHSTYVNAFQQNGGAAVLGAPSNNVHRWENGFTQDFIGGSEGQGAIMKSDANDNSYLVSGKIWDKFYNLGGAIDTFGIGMGYPTSDRIDIKGGLANLANGGGVVQNFQGNRKIWLSKEGVFATWGDIGTKYESLGGANGFLRFPTSDEIKLADSSVKQTFQGGYIVWKAGQPTIVYDTSALKSLPADSGHGSTSDWSVQFWNNQTMSGAPVWTGREQPGELRFAAGQGAPIGTTGIQEDHFAGRWVTTSYFDGGIYNFISQADDGVRVYIDDVNIIDKWVNQPFAKNSSYFFVPSGYHNVRVEYFENSDSAANTLKWERANPVGEWAGEFFNNQNLQGVPVGHRGGGTGFLDKNWGNGHEFGVPVGDDHFSDRWTTTRFFKSGAYEFNSQSDDGARVWVDDKLVLDKWGDQPFVSNRFLVSLTEGYHKIRVEHFENAGAAATKLAWGEVISSRPTIQPWVGEYFNNRDLTGAPVLTRLDGSSSNGLNFDWKNGSPDSRIQQDNFSARWTTHVNLTKGTYTFSVTGDDGVRLYVDGELVLNRWQDQPFAASTTTLALANGLHKVQLEYYERGESAAVKLDWKRELFGSAVYTPAANSQGTVDSTFRDAYNQLVSTLGNDKVGVAINSLQTVVGQEGKFQEFRGVQGRGALLQQRGRPTVTYAFGELWEAYQQAGGPSALGFPVSSQKDLGDGAYELQLPKGRLFWAPGMTNPTYYEYFDRTQSLTIPVDAWRGEYFNNQNWSGDPVLVRGSGSINNDWGFDSPFGSIPTDHFSVRWSSQKPFDRGTYRFVGTHDDGFKVTVNGQAPINKLIDTSAHTTGYATFTQSGQYQVQASYFENDGWAQASLTHEKASNYVVGLESNNNLNQSVIDAFLWQGGYDKVGVPTNDVHRWGNGWVQDFDGGSNGWGIVMKQDGAQYARYTTGGIWQYMREHGGVNHWGYPVEDAQRLPNGAAYQTFERGVLFSGAQVFGIEGATLSAFNRNGGFSQVGMPMNDAHRWGNSTVQNFDGGSRGSGILMQKDGSNSAYYIFGDIWNVYKNYGGIERFGQPIEDIQNFNGVKYQLFERGSVVRSQYGTFPLWGGIQDYYVNTTGGLGGVLGVPKSAEYQWQGKTRQNFENGYIIWNGSSAIGYKPDGSLLFPPPNNPEDGSFEEVPLFANPTPQNPLKGFRHPLSGAGSVTQGPGGSYSHQGREQYAIDYGVPLGTPVYAMRSGKIVGIRDVYPDTGGGAENYNKFNYILVEHDGGYYSAYLHLQQAFVNKVGLSFGDTVGAGQLIGYSGNSGWSTGPHLHVEVQKGKWGQTVPFTFNTDNSSNGSTGGAGNSNNPGNSSTLNPILPKMDWLITDDPDPKRDKYWSNFDSDVVFNSWSSFRGVPLSVDYEPPLGVKVVKVEDVAQESENNLRNFFNTWNLPFADQHMEHFLNQGASPSNLTDIPVDELLQYVPGFQSEYEARINQVKSKLLQYAETLRQSGQRIQSGEYWINIESPELYTGEPDHTWIYEKNGKKFSQGVDLFEKLTNDALTLLQNAKQGNFIGSIGSLYATWKLLDFYNAIGRFEYNTSVKVIVEDDSNIYLTTHLYVHDYFNFDVKLDEFPSLSSPNLKALSSWGLRFGQSVVPEILVNLGMANNYEQTGVSKNSNFNLSS